VEIAIDELRALIESFGGRFDVIDQRMDREFAAVRREIREGDETVKRHVTVLIEDVRADIRLIAEGHRALAERMIRVEQRLRSVISRRRCP
jgi:hypothetical protein